MNKTLIIIVLLVIHILFCKGSLDSLKGLREKVNKVKNNIKVVTESKRGTSINFVPRSEILYPGLDIEKADKVKRLWQDYYDCQQALYESNQRLVVPQALAFLQGSSAVLECEVCEYPRDMFLETKWFYAADYNMDHITEITTTSSIFVKNDSLNIYNMGDNRGGMYVCRKGNHTARPYIVHVFSKEVTKKVVPPRNSEGNHPAPDIQLTELGLTIITRWAEWTQCSRCDQVGKRYRHGICTIVSHKGSRQKRRTYLQTTQNEMLVNKSTQESSTTITSPGPQLINKNITEELGTVNNTTLSLPVDQTEPSSEQNRTQYTTEPNILMIATEGIPTNISLKDDLEILSMFEEGIPCRSKLLSQNIRNLEVIANRSSEILVSYCKISCPQSVMFVVVDDKGNIVETANNSDGVYSVLQGLPKVLPAISRTAEFATYNKFFKMQCPGNRNGDVPVEWNVGRKTLTNKVLKSETHGRIKIDEYNRLTFNPVLFEDSRVFSCWQHRDLVGTVHLLVEKEHNLHFEHSIMIIGTIIIFSMFFWVYYNAFKNA